MALTAREMSRLWSLHPASRPSRFAGSPEDAVANVALGYRPTVGYEAVEDAATIVGGAQALLDAGFPVPRVSTERAQLATSARIMRKAVADKGLAPLAFAYRGLQILAHAGPAMAGRNLVTLAGDMLAPLTLGISAGVSAIVRLQGAIANLRLQKIGASFAVIAKSWTNELEKRKIQALDQKTQRLEAATERALAVQAALERGMSPIPPGHAASSTTEKYLPWVMVGAVGLLAVTLLS